MTTPTYRKKLIEVADREQLRFRFGLNLPDNEESHAKDHQRIVENAKLTRRKISH